MGRESVVGQPFFNLHDTSKEFHEAVKYKI